MIPIRRRNPWRTEEAALLIAAVAVRDAELGATMKRSQDEPSPDAIAFRSQAMKPLELARMVIGGGTHLTDVQRVACLAHVDRVIGLIEEAVPEGRK